MLPALFVSGFLRKPQILIYNVQAILKKPALRHTLWRPPDLCEADFWPWSQRKASSSTPMPESNTHGAQHEAHPLH